MRAVVVLAFFACSDAHRQDATPPAPVAVPAVPSPPDASAALTVTLGGRPVHIADVVTWREAGWRQVFVASTHPLTCEPAGPSRERDGDVTFEVSIASTLRPDGTYAPQIRAFSYEGAVDYRGSWAHATDTAVDVDFALTGAIHHRVLHVAGPLVASRSCPMPAPPALVGAPQRATITIAGQRRAVRFAWFFPAGGADNFYQGDTLLLYTGGESCAGAGVQPSDLIVALTWLNASDTQPGAIALHGTAISNVSGPARDIEVTPRPRSAGRYTIRGTAEVVGYRVEVTGRITVESCPRSP